MRVVIALGGRAAAAWPADDRREPTGQRPTSRRADRAGRARQQVVVAHGNGPQVGLLALQAAAYKAVRPYPLDILGAQTEAMIGYVIEQDRVPERATHRCLRCGRPLAWVDDVGWVVVGRDSAHDMCDAHPYGHHVPQLADDVQTKPS